MSKEGLGIIVAVLLFSLTISIGVWVTGNHLLLVTSIICWILLAFILFFFRDPERHVPEGNNLIISPADGKIIEIREENEPEFLEKKATKISIFLSLFNVHINRIPIDGKVTYFDYARGKFYPAFKKIASIENEQTIIGIENTTCKILMKQIAGMFARRIVCHVRAGHKVKKGERFGIIKFGSRVDICIPTQVKLQVKLNDNVKAGESILGLIDEKQ